MSSPTDPAHQHQNGQRCACCAERHDGPLLAFHLPAPAYWSPEFEGQEGCSLTDELCVIDDQHFFVRALIEIPVHGQVDPFVWGAWASLSEDSYTRTVAAWETPGRESAAPVFGWLSSALPGYRRSTLRLKTMVHTRAVGLRPLLDVEPTRHRLAREQHGGITQAALARRLKRLIPPA
ncbi:DUF2199 domain-containing protein [Oerskovia gallyi]|uniref:DUF2199 domain-containing protein n=1 Tax=Oerskovia gallyi TaxID=2762226 RepID=A0ABR8UYE1_9CELL|nr:DUF2199 domain-containing protein [Oerskovia gallyi]MBD7997555.1 DUF2199 domain-containing protein [Oerskovia gallyi]